MATFADAVGFLVASKLAEIFIPFILIFALVYAILQKTKAIGGKPDMDSIVSLAVALAVVISPGFRAYVLELTPFIAVFLAVIFFAMLAFLMYGVDLGDITKATKKPIVYLLFIAIVAIFAFFVLNEVYTSYSNTTGFPSDIYAENVTLKQVSGEGGFNVVIRHPAVLGTVTLLVLLAVSVYAIVYIPKKKE
ncbi:MAG TPA: hypothetical protein ENG01_00980 [Candidatus Aenigmarchaeota archaeon]|nr:hypothetical protein [Candidatus Aenigmarchaeota archaeon]HEX32969.1 hypothetical protein [Candidatus Aenigmarchaeota archaeon]